jgi:nickel/cobalt transporter (NicO) family protein
LGDAGAICLQGVIALQRAKPLRLSFRRLLPALLLLTSGGSVLAQTRSPFGLGGPVPSEAQTSGLIVWLLQQQAHFHQQLTQAISAVGKDPAALATLIGLAFAYGVLHAVGPGHGKAVIASYLVANERAMKRGVALAFGAAAVQALIALGVVGIVAGLMGGTAAMMNTSVTLVEKLGFMLIIGMGVWIVWQRLRRMATPLDATCLGPDCGHDHGGDPRRLALAGRRELILTAIGAGIRPCTGAIILLVFALAKGLWLAGVLSASAMATGTAIGTSVFAVLAVKAKVIALNLISGRDTRWRKLGLALELAAGVALILLGAALLAGSMAGGN